MFESYIEIEKREMNNKLVSETMLTLLLISMLAFSFNIQPAKTDADKEALFFDDFDDGLADGWTENLGVWSVIAGEYYTSVGIANSITTVDDLNLSDCTIEVELQLTDSIGFRAGIVFRYIDNEHFYAFAISNEYDVAWMKIYTPQYPLYGYNNESMFANVTISPNTNYTLKVQVQGETLTGFLDDQELVSWTDGNYSIGKVGLLVHRADVYFDDFRVYSIPRTWIVDDDGPADFHIIQKAINAANEEDDIFVSSGIYYENIVVNKTVSLIGENKSTTTIDGNETGTVIYITAYNVNISGFTVQNSGTLRWDCGIYIHSFGNNLFDNAIRNNNNGIHIIGGNNILRSNKLDDNVYSFGVSGSTLSHYTQDIDISNQINGKPIYFWVSQYNLQVPNNAGYVGIVNSQNITLSNLNLTSNGQGILLAYSTNCLIKNMNISNNRFGIFLHSSGGNSLSKNLMLENEVGVYLYFSWNNTVEENTIDSQASSGIEIHWSNSNSIVENTVRNTTSAGIGVWGSGGNEVLNNDLHKTRIGIALDSQSTIIMGNTVLDSYEGLEIQSGSHNNTLYLNNFINNTMQLRFTSPYSLNDTWDNGCEGNYWSNYNGSDLDGDGIGDEYLPWETVDYYPLMNPYWNPADTNHDLKVNIIDIFKTAKAFGSYPSHPNWNCHADITGSEYLKPDEKVDVRDLFLIAKNFGQEWT
jgi:parallel beta-helix repeat protein